jgi:hypothetical protein
MVVKYLLAIRGGHGHAVQRLGRLEYSALANIAGRARGVCRKPRLADAGSQRHFSAGSARDRRAKSGLANLTRHMMSLGAGVYASVILPRNWRMSGR